MNTHLPLLDNPYVRLIAGGIAAAIIVASPIVDDGVTPSEALSILGAFLSGSGLTAVSNGRGDSTPDEPAVPEAPGTDAGNAPVQEF